MLPPDNALEDGPSGAAEELAVRVTVNGTTVMATYVIEAATVLLTSADFGEASAALSEQAPEAAAARLLRQLAEAAMARSGARYMRDDEVNAPEASGT
jgi:hypothetical protein